MLNLFRSLHTASDGTIFVGSFGDFGMLESDSIGQLKYSSIYQGFAGESNEFTDVWTIVETSSHIYFHAQEQIFEYDGKGIKALTMPSTVHTLFLWKDQLLARMKSG